MRRAFTQVRNGRPRPVLVEIPDRRHDRGRARAAELQARAARAVGARPAGRGRGGRRAGRGRAAGDLRRPGRPLRPGLAALRELAELLEAPVTTSLEGKSAFPENHPLSLGSGGRSMPKAVRHFLDKADVIFGIGCSFATTNYGVRLPRNGPNVHPRDARRGRPQQGPADRARAARRRGADAGRADRRGQRPPRRQAARPCGRPSRRRSRTVRDEWLAEWKPKLTCERDAAVALPRHLGPAAHRGRGQHDHHPRRRQPARPARAVLAADRRR